MPDLLHFLYWRICTRSYPSNHVTIPFQVVERPDDCHPRCAEAPDEIVFARETCAFFVFSARQAPCKTLIDLGILRLSRRRHLFHRFLRSLQTLCAIHRPSASTECNSRPQKDESFSRHLSDSPDQYI